MLDQNPFCLPAAQAPLDCVAQRFLEHWVIQGIARVAWREMTDAALTRLMRPAGVGLYLAIIGTAAQENADRNIVGRGVLLVGREPVLQALRYWVRGVGDLDVEALKRPVTDVAAAHELEVFPALRVQPH